MKPNEYQFNQSLKKAREGQFLYTAYSSQSVLFREEVVRLSPPTKAAKRARKPEEQQTFDASLDAFLADLIKASAHIDALGHFYRSSKKEGFSDSECKVTARHFITIRDCLVEHGFMEKTKGYNEGDGWVGRARRYRATPKLLNLANEYGITAKTVRYHYAQPYFPESLKRLPPLMLKSSKKHRMPLNGSSKEKRLADQVIALRQGINNHTYNLETHPVLYRIFSKADHPDFNYDQGGRLYGSYQNLSQAERSQITIDGEATKEIDLKASHLTILHARCGYQLPKGDPYYVEGVPRSLVKGLITAMMGLGKANLAQWPKELRVSLQSGELLGGPELSDEELNRLYPFKELKVKVLSALPVLLKLKSDKLDWGWLQYIESEVIIATMNELLHVKGIGVLPVHDSIIVPASAHNVATDVLTRHFRNLIGVKPILTTM